MAIKPLFSILDAYRQQMEGFGYSTSVYANVLAANVAEKVTVPTGAKYVLFSGTANFYVLFGADPTAAVPATEVSDGSASCLNPGLRAIDGAAKIGLISPTDCVVTMEFFS
jgi:hypothetical protein